MRNKAPGQRPASIAGKVRQIRIERRWTQAQLAKLLGLSQNRLSEIERGQGSFTAEHFLQILKTFNITVDHFAPAKVETGLQLQNALARLGGSHLYESPDVLPTETLKQVNEVILETLVSAESARLIIALAPVIVLNIKKINLFKLKADLAEVGFERRFGWVLENTLEALRRELGQSLSREWKFRYKRAETILSNFLPSWQHDRDHPVRIPAEEILDNDIASEETLGQVRASSSRISGAWRIVTRIQAADFVQALRASRGTD